MTDARPSMTAALDAFGFDVVVAPIEGPPVQTRALWLPADTAQVPSRGGFSKAEPKRTLALPLDGLPSIPRGTIITGPEYLGAEPIDWTVDAAVRVDFDHYRVIVLPVAVAA